MAQIFVFGLLIASIILFVKGLKKFKVKEYKNSSKKILISILCFAVMVLTIGILAKNQDKQDKVKAAELAKYHASPEYKAKVAKEKAEADAKSKADAIKKQAEIKQAFIKDVLPNINDWNNAMNTNMNGTGGFNSTLKYLAEGGWDTATCYTNMQTIQSNLDQYVSDNIDPVDGMTDGEKKLLSDYVQDMQYAFSSYAASAGKVADMINTGNLQPSTMAQVKQDNALGQQSYTKAQMELGALKGIFGVK